MYVAPGSTRLNRKCTGVGAESQIPYSRAEHLLALCCRLCVANLWDGDSCIGTFIRDCLGDWHLREGGEGGRTGQREKLTWDTGLTRSLADLLGCSKDRVVLQGVPSWGEGAMALFPHVGHSWDVAAFGRRQIFGPGSHPKRLTMESCLLGTKPRTWGLLVAKESLGGIWQHPLNRVALGSSMTTNGLGVFIESYNLWL